MARATRWSVLIPALLALSCKASPGEPCNAGDECSSELVCHQGSCADPQTYCRTAAAHAKRCEREGRCSLVDGACVATSEQDCKESTRCKELGVCNFVGPCCSRDEVCPHDQEDPLTHVARLADPATRDAAVAKLATIAESTMLQDGGDPKGPHAKALFDDVVPGLAQLVMSQKLAPASYAKLLQLLAASRHPQAAEALVHAVRQHHVDAEQPTAVDGAMARVLDAVADMKLIGARPAVFKLFRQLRASWKKAQLEGFSRSLQRAVLSLADPGWQEEIVTLLGRPIDPRGNVQQWTNERYWQRTGARVLGFLRADKAIEPLLRIVLTPAKSDVAPAATEALVRIGKPAAAMAAQVLAGNHPALVALARTEHGKAVARDVGEAANRGADDVRETAAAQLLAAIGRADESETVLEALDQVDMVGKGRIAIALAHLPPTPERLDAFKSTFDVLPMDVPIDKRLSGVAALFEAAPRFFDASLTPWIVDKAVGLRGTDSALAPMREPALEAALLLMTAEQVTEVDRLVELITQEKLGSEKIAARSMVGRCKAELDCYLETLAKAGAEPKDSFDARKAATMVGVHAKAEHKSTIASLLPKLRAPAARRLTALALVHLSPEGDAKLADQLDKALDSLALSDPQVSAAVGRLRARAQ